MTERSVSTLRLGDEFYVEHEGADPIPVRFVAPCVWGLVHGVMDMPCLRLDTKEHVTVAINPNATVRMVDQQEGADDAKA